MTAPDTASDTAVLRLDAVTRVHGEGETEVHALKAVTFTADGKELLTGSVGQALIAWDSDSWQEQARFVGHTGAITGLYVTKTADATIFVSHALRRAILGRTTLTSSHVIYNGVADEATFDERRRAAEALRGRRQPFTFVLVGRFRFVYAVLALIVGVAVGGFIVMTDTPGTGGGPAWSSWKPSGDPSEQMQDIASYVAPRYRNEDGKRQLVAVTASKPPTVQQVPVRYMVLSPGGGSQNISVLPAEKTASSPLAQPCVLATPVGL